MTPELPAAEEYAGHATLTAGDQRLEVEVTLRSVFQPIDGRLHWYGRIAPSAQLDDQCTSGSTVSLTTSAGTAEGRINDMDPWGRFRISGLGRPPF